MQINEVKVCFKNNSKPYSFDCGDLEVKINDRVIVETVRGEEIGTVCSLPKMVEGETLLDSLKPVLRIATIEDENQFLQNEKREQEIKNACEHLSNALNLGMKIISAEMNFEGSKVIICFSADGRVDFRELVKQLAGKFRMRIELKQVDAREETKMVGGLGPCGRECCCYSFLKEPERSNIKMAKNQNVSLNPTSLNGLCGKIKCCLAYENQAYAEAIKAMPQVNSIVATPDGKGSVVYNNLLKRIVTVKFTTPDGETKMQDYELNDIKRLEDNND